MLTNEQIDALKRQAYAGRLNAASPFTEHDMVFIRAIEAAARAEALEDAANVAEQTVCDTHLPTGVRIYGTRAGTAIRAMKEQA